MRAPRSAPGVEETANQFADVQKVIRKIIPPEEIETLADIIGMPISGINMTYNNTGGSVLQDGDIQIKLRKATGPTEEYVQALREQLPRAFPGITFAFLPADIVSQILNFGAHGADRLAGRGNDHQCELRLCEQAVEVGSGAYRGIADARIQQSPNNPTSTSMLTGPARNMSA